MLLKHVSYDSVLHTILPFVSAMSSPLFTLSDFPPSSTNREISHHHTCQLAKFLSPRLIDTFLLGAILFWSQGTGTSGRSMHAHSFLLTKCQYRSVYSLTYITLHQQDIFRYRYLCKVCKIVDRIFADLTSLYAAAGFHRLPNTSLRYQADLVPSNRPFDYH